MKTIKIILTWLLVALATLIFSLILQDETWIAISFLIWPFVLWAYIRTKKILRKTNRTTRFFFDWRSCRIVWWKKNYRPKYTDTATYEQVSRARERMLNLNT